MLLQERARLYFTQLYPSANPEDFKGSAGWLKRFNERHGIRNTVLRGESLSADTSSIEPIHFALNLYVDETGLWWCLTPASSLNAIGRTQTANFKKAKDHVTILGCTNASGTHRLPITLINKSLKPHGYEQSTSAPFCTAKVMDG